MPDALPINSSQPRAVAGTLVGVTASPKDPLFIGGVYEQLRAARAVRDPGFVQRDVSRQGSAETRVSPQARTLPIAKDSIRPMLPALTEARVSASTKAVTTTSTSALSL